MAAKAKAEGKAPKAAKTNGKTPDAKDKGKAPKAKASGKAPKELLKRQSGKSGTRPKEILNRLRRRAEVAETALRNRITITVKKRPRDAEPITINQTMASLAALPRDDIEILIARLQALHSAL